MVVIEVVLGSGGRFFLEVFGDGWFWGVVHEGFLEVG